MKLIAPLFVYFLWPSTIRQAFAGKIEVTGDEDSSSFDIDFNQVSTFDGFASGITYTLVANANIEVSMSATGGSGATGHRSGANGLGALGGSSQGTFTFVKDQVYKLRVGGPGKDNRNGSRGGFSGGGNGNGSTGAGGGGFTGLFIDSIAHENSILIAGGGGGGGDDPGHGGTGGGLAGGWGSGHNSSRGGSGGSQTTAGSRAGDGGSSSGSQLQGGSGGAGGGGGYYGGGGSSSASNMTGGGGGGSGYIHPTLITNGSTSLGEGLAPLNNQPSGTFALGLISISGNAGGDPHFTTFNGIHFSFHGECDLVLMKSQSFSSGQGFDLHIRTTRVENYKVKYSFISGVALRIGTNIMEVLFDGSLIFNKGERLVYESSESTTFAGFSLTKALNGLSKRIIEYVLDLGNERAIKIRVNTKTNMMFVQVDGNINDSEGLMGNPGVNGLYGRDGMTDMSDSWNSFAMEWQVQDYEPKLFEEDRAPQYPQGCRFDIAHPRRVKGKKNLRRRLLLEDRPAKDVGIDEARKACARSRDDAMKEFCIQDVIATGMVELASDPFYI